MNEENKNNIAFTWLCEGDSGSEAIEGFIEDLVKKMDLHGILWWHDEDVYFGVSQEPFNGERLREWAEEIIKQNFNFPDEDVTAEQIVKEAEKIEPRE